MGRLVALALVAAASAHAAGVGPPQTYSGVGWTMTSAGVPALVPCTRLTLDATGDLVRSTTLSFAGTLNCPSLNAGYTVWGAGYVGNDGSLNITLSIAGQWTLSCSRLFGLAGPCSIYDPLGIPRGTANLLLL